jgi:nicotinamidase-related amidase
MEKYLAENTALVIVDLQNDFVREGAGMEVPSARDTIEANQRLIAFAREQGIPVIYTKFMAGPKKTFIWERSPEIEKVKACHRNFKRYYPDVKKELECTDVIDELRPEKEDYIVEKYGYSAFNNTNLTDILKSLHANTVIVTGTVTQICVEDTVHAAFHNGLNVVVAKDAVSSFSQELQDAALKNIGMKYGAVMDSAEIIQVFLR